MTDCKPVAFPGDPQPKLTKEMCPDTEHHRNEMTKIPKRAAVGSLMFLMTCGRPEISFEVSKVAYSVRILENFTGKQSKGFTVTVKEQEVKS